MPINIDGSTGIDQATTSGTVLPTGSDSQRPSNPSEGTMRVNTGGSGPAFLEVYLNGNWVPYSSGNVFQPVDASGGTVTDVIIDEQTYRVHSYTNPGTSTFVINDAGSEQKIDVIVAAGGGGGGGDRGGGGGAGEVIIAQGLDISSGNYDVIVGSGGSGGPGADTNGSPGSNSKFDTYEALGGGEGRHQNGGVGGEGGSGGGSGTSTTSRGGFSYRLSRLGLGNDGQRGDGNHGFNGSAGGGGGAGGTPQEDPLSDNSDSNLNRFTNGGVGVSIAHLVGEGFGADQGWIGGGGGGGTEGNDGGTVFPFDEYGIDRSRGGRGGGGNGGSARTGVTTRNDDGDPAVNGTGGGGGGGNLESGSGGSGGNGIVIIRYPI